MALSLSNHLFSACPCLSNFVSSSPSYSKPTRTVALRYPHSGTPLFRPFLGFSPVNNTRPCFKSSFAINNEEDFDNGLRESESNADKKRLSSLKKLIEVYKEAVFNGNEHTVSDIEARICILENEKNELLQKVSALSSEITSAKEKFICLQADFDNFRKRSEKERLTARSDAQGEVIESLLLIVDSFERAKQQVKPATEKEKGIDRSYQGIYKQFVETMTSMQVAVVPTVGKPFDPSLHEAVARVEYGELKEGIIVQETSKGFLLGDRLLRPAMVKVSAGPGQKKSPAAPERSAGRPSVAASVDNQ